MVAIRLPRVRFPVGAAFFLLPRFPVGASSARGSDQLKNSASRDLIIHDPVHHGANGAAMPTDEDNQGGHFFFNHPERGTTPLPRHAQPLLLLFRSNPPQ